MPRELTDICHIPVKFSEIDSMRIVWHGNYVVYFEDGRESFGRHYPGIGYEVMQATGIYAPIYDVHMRHYASLRMGDIAVVHTTFVPKRGAINTRFTARAMVSFVARVKQPNSSLNRMEH